MAHWVVMAFFNASDSILSPMFIWWVPGFNEARFLLLLYLVLPITRGTLLLYRGWLQPLLVKHEAAIDEVFSNIGQEAAWMIKRLGGVMANKAVQGGGEIVRRISRSTSLADFRSEEAEKINRIVPTTNKMQHSQWGSVGALDNTGQLVEAETRSKVAMRSKRQTVPTTRRSQIGQQRRSVGGWE